VRLESRLPDLAAKNRQLVAEHKNLELLRLVAAPNEHDQLQQAADDDVQGWHKQRRPPASGEPDATATSATLEPHPSEFLHPTRCDGHSCARGCGSDMATLTCSARIDVQHFAHSGYELGY
jgi:hypothetical protein